MSGFDWDAILSDQADDADNEFKAIPGGTYTVEVVAASGEKSAKDNEYVKLTCKVVDGPYANRLLFTNIMFILSSSSSMKFTIRDLKALGITTTWLKATGAKPAQIAEQVVGSVVTAVVTDDEIYNDAKQNKIKSLKALAGPSAVRTPVDIKDNGFPF